MSSLLFLVILLCFPISACNALNLTVRANSSNTSFSHSRKDMARVRLDESTSVQETKSRPFSNRFASSERLNVSDAQEKDAKRPRKEIVSGATQITSLVRSSLLVPRKGRREHPGFDVDYMGPRTHPPSHN